MSGWRGRTGRVGGLLLAIATVLGAGVVAAVRASGSHRPSRAPFHAAEPTSGIRDDREPVDAQHGSPHTGRILVVADLRGHLKPCGCAPAQPGGLPRLASSLGFVRHPEDQVVQAGLLAGGPVAYNRIRLDCFLEYLEASNVGVLVPAAADLALGEAFASAVRRLPRTRVLAANVLLRESRRAAFDGFHVIRSPGGPPVAVVGLTGRGGESPEPHADLYEVLPPWRALREILAGIPPDVGATIVVLAGEVPGLGDLAAAAPPDVLLVVAAGADRLPSPGAARGAAVFPLPVRGAAIGIIDPGRALMPQARRVLTVDPGVPEDQAMGRAVHACQVRLKMAGNDFAVSTFRRFRDSGRRGSAACTECHGEEHAAWERSPHAGAMRTLESRGMGRNPECMECHLQDLPRDGAPLSSVGVGCESCHGGAEEHIRWARESPAERAPRPLADATRSCVRCHDAENSPHFDPAVAWERIRHGRGASNAVGASPAPGTPAAPTRPGED